MNLFKKTPIQQTAPPSIVLPELSGELTEILEGCEKVPKSDFVENDVMEKLAKLEAVGFRTASENLISELAKKERLQKASGYLKVTHENIVNFLKKKLPKSAPATSYFYSRPSLATKHPELGKYKQYSFSLSPFQAQASQMQVGNYFCPKPGVEFFFESIGNKAYAWLEIPIELYKQSPPLHILDRLAEEKKKNVFDRYVVASVEEYDLPEIVDPLLLGVIEGIEDRFFVAQWDKDISIDDLV